MAGDLHCPVCDAHFPLGGDEVAGDPVCCSYCGAHFTLTRPTGSGDGFDLDDEF